MAKSKSKNVTVIEVQGWTLVFLDDKQVYWGKTPKPAELLNALGITVTEPIDGNELKQMVQDRMTDMDLTTTNWEAQGVFETLSSVQEFVKDTKKAALTKRVKELREEAKRLEDKAKQI